jgi:hypothetical protein
MLLMLAIGAERLIEGSSFPGLGICFLYTNFGVPVYYQIVVLGLISLFGMKEMLLVSKRKDRLSLDSMDMGILPLVICFITVFLFIGFEIIFSQLYP